jgi:GH15 family glucan-1,4-alpha-glucosidase
VSSTPIADHALLSDCHSAALIDRAGSVEWWCAPRFDSPSLFGRLLDDRAGHFSIRPGGDVRVERRYLDGTLVLVTVFHTAEGTVELTDALAMAEGVRGHDLGAGSPRALLRRAVCTRGRVEMDVDFAPRFEYGLTIPALQATDDGLIARGGPAAVRLSTTANLDLGDEGTFLLCTFWLAEALARAGRVEHAREVFERAAAYRNDVDLLAEEVDPDTGELLGNFPQAFSHIGLVNAAWAISQAEQSIADHGAPSTRPV